MKNDELVDNFEVEFSDLLGEETGSRLESLIVLGLRFFRRGGVVSGMRRMAFCAALVTLVLVLSGSNLIMQSRSKAYVTRGVIVATSDVTVYITGPAGQDVTGANVCPTVDFLGVGEHWVSIGMGIPMRVVFNAPDSPISYDKVLSKQLTPQCLQQFYQINTSGP